ncbi:MULTISPECIES: STT3 domain-containing protein [unclassified Archaeoglobus]|jgi:dolichyl-diphosphooligosaccharide--protein glycosyltransferase|uniref:STT3 domain-containing protein n=1 Tax=unclassified Archaeoglobus TaxID=2643606 RepID=UPI0025C201BE|nr:MULTISPECIES: STT3 domain-containing protein [unclassified Archaeoglobus]
MWLVVIIILAALLRLQNFQVFSLKLPSGYDPFYHLRLAEIIVKSGYRPKFDHYLNYPYGLKIGWPPLFDYILAIPGMLFGFDATVYFALVFPVVLGVLNTFLVYVIARRFGDENFALLSALVYATIPAAVHTSILGFADYHAWNMFLVLLAFYLLLRYPLAAGIPLAILAFSWVGAPIYAAVLALAAFLHFEDRKLLYVIPAFLVPVVSAVISHTVALSFVAITAFLAVGIFIKRFDNLRVELGYVTVSALTLAVLYFAPIKELSLVKSGVSYLIGANIYLPTIAEAQSFDFVGVMSLAGYLSFLLALPSLFMLRNRLLHTFFFASFALSLLQNRFTEILAVPVSLFAASTLVYIFERTEVIVREEEVVERKRTKRRDKKKRHKEKKKLTLGDKAVVAAFLAFIFSPAVIISIKPYEMSEDWYNALRWIDEDTEPTSYYLHPDKGKPEYSVLSWWDYGNWIVFVAKRPVVCNNFQAGAVDAAKFFTAQSEGEAMKIIKKRGVRYVITDEEMNFKNESGIYTGKFEAIMSIAGFSPELMEKEEILEFYNASMLYKLHVENAENLKHFRLVKEFGRVKVFEVEIGRE